MSYFGWVGVSGGVWSIILGGLGWVDVGAPLDNALLFQPKSTFRSQNINFLS